MRDITIFCYNFPSCSVLCLVHFRDHQNSKSCAHVLKSNNFCQKPWAFPPNLWVIAWCSSRNAASKMSPYENRHVHLFQFSTVRLKVWGDGSPQDLFWSSGEKPFSWVPLGSKTLPVCPNWDCCYKRLVHTDICAKYFLTIFLKIGTFISYLTSMFLAFIVMFWTVSLKQTLHCHSMLQGLSQHAFTAPTNLFIFILCHNTPGNKNNYSSLCSQWLWR